MGWASGEISILASMTTACLAAHRSGLACFACVSRCLDRRSAVDAGPRTAFIRWRQLLFLVGDLIVTKTSPEWCDGRTRPGNGVRVSWQEFIDWMNS